jgi:glycosyltransferase involved in cell wall biosynthesis
MKRIELSVTIITLNEEILLQKCLESVKAIADEIILVDSGSKDKTINIAEKFGAKIYTRRFDNYANQKNYAMSKASGKWILSIDADEEIEPELAREIELKIKNDDSVKKYKNNSDYIAFTIPRKNIIFGKYIKYTRWQPELDRHVWLWKKDTGVWVGDVHEEVVVKDEVGRMKNAKIHYQYETVREFLDMMNRYSEHEAKQKIDNGYKFSYFKFFSAPIYNFFVRYIYRLGFLDGWRGFILSYLMAIYHISVWVKVWEKQAKY